MKISFMDLNNDITCVDACYAKFDRRDNLLCARDLSGRCYEFVVEDERNRATIIADIKSGLDMLHWHFLKER